MIFRLYQFQFGSTVFRFTDQEDPVTHQGQAFTPVPISHTPPEQSGDQTGSNIEISMAFNDEFTAPFVLNFVQIAPAGLTDVTVFKGDTNNSPSVTVLWTGSLNAVTFGERDVVLLCKPIASVFTREGPRASYGTLCNNEFTDNICLVNPDDFTEFAIQVTGLALDGVTFTLGGLTVSQSPNYVDGTFTGGKMRESANSLNTRLIVDHVGDVITVQYPFLNLGLGSVVDVVQGCDHAISTCDTKFDNVVNFFGFFKTPRQNPFDVGLDRI